MKLDVYNQKGEKTGSMDLPKEIFEVPFNSDLVHQAMVTQMANARKVIAKTKDRSEVRGGGRKPWRQKGTGRARHGSIRSPIWKGGGITFGPTGEQNYKKKINKKAKRKALFMALSSKANDEEIILLDNLKLEAPKTKNLVDILDKMSNVKAQMSPKKNQRFSTGQANQAQISKSKKEKSKPKKTSNEFLVVIPEKDESVTRANRNIPYTKTLRADSLNVLDLLSYKYLVMTKGCVDVIRETYLKNSKHQAPNNK